MMQEKSTDELEKMLASIKPDKIDKYLEDNKNYMADIERPFYIYMKETVKGKRMLLKDIYIRMDIEEKWGSRILTQECHTKNRDFIIAMCLAAHFTIQEINTALKLYEMKPLYAKDKRDAIIMVAVNNRIYEISDVDELLKDKGEHKLIIMCQENE